MFFLLFVQLIRINRFAIFDVNISAFDPGNIVFQNIFCVLNADRNDGSIGFGGDLHASLFKRKEVVCGIAGALRRDIDGISFFDQGDGIQDHSHILLHVAPVHKEAVQEIHPLGDHGELFDLNL